MLRTIFFPSHWLLSHITIIETTVREECILLQWLSSILGKNIGRARDRTIDLLFSSPQRYQLSYGAGQLQLSRYLNFGPIQIQTIFKPVQKSIFFFSLIEKEKLREKKRQYLPRALSAFPIMFSKAPFVKSRSVWKRMNPFPYKLWFLRVSKSFENTLGKRRNCSLRAISPFSHSVFNPFGQSSAIYIKFEIVVCKLFQLGRVYNFVIWEWVNL